MAAAQQGQDRIVPTDSPESLNTLAIDAEEKGGGADKLKDQILAAREDRIVSSSVSHDSKAIGPSRDAAGQPGSLDAGKDRNAFYPPNIYAPQAHTFYYGGYENPTNVWEEYPQYVNSEGMELGSPVTGIYNENQSVVFHTGYSYNPQMPYGPYSPATTPMPSMRGDGQIYPQQFPFTGPYYQQPVPHSMPYISSPTPVSQPELSLPMGIDPQGFEVFGSGKPSTDWSKSSESQRVLANLPSPAVSPQPLGAPGAFGHNVSNIPAGMGSHQQRPMYGFGSSTSSFNRGYSHGGVYQGMNFTGSSPVLEMNGRSWIAVDKGRRRGRGSGSLCSCNGTVDVLNEQNRGPRASRPKNPILDRSASADDQNSEAISKAQNDLYNRHDFATEYKDARFFVIKSYSEDNVHKSIKYGVWASTANGNRRLDAAYHEAKAKDSQCPVFLFFSVNASAQFCGVAEMMGPVDFDRSVNYWQQDKWSGQFPVKWHMIKDVPNSHFRHIILENNDNKPVTNSRDTQEVKLEQGLEMLRILKNYEAEQSILDDFEYYEERQKIMQERKARQQAALTPNSTIAGSDHRGVDFVEQITKDLAQSVRLEESGKEEERKEAVKLSAEEAAKAAKNSTSLQSN